MSVHVHLFVHTYSTVKQTRVSNKEVKDHPFFPSSHEPLWSVLHTQDGVHSTDHIHRPSLLQASRAATNGYKNEEVK